MPPGEWKPKLPSMVLSTIAASHELLMPPPSLAPFPLITDRLAVSVPVLPMPPIPKP
jgi:hypothetical protein